MATFPPTNAAATSAPAWSSSYSPTFFDSGYATNYQLGLDGWKYGSVLRAPAAPLNWSSFGASSYSAAVPAPTSTTTVLPPTATSTVLPPPTSYVAGTSTAIAPFTGTYSRGFFGAGYNSFGAGFHGHGAGFHGDRGIIVGEEIINIPVRVPIYQKQVAIAPTQVQYVDRVAPAQVQYIDKVVEKVVEKLVRVYACNGCGKDIEGECLDTANGKFHRECYLTCAGCGQWIQFSAFEALGMFWHASCFTCSVCGKECSGGYIVHNGRAAHSLCARPVSAASVSSGMAAKRAIRAKTFEEAVRYDTMGGGEPDGKYNGITIECDDPRWLARAKERGYNATATWEVSDAAMAERYASAGSSVVVSRDGVVDGNV